MNVDKLEKGIRYITLTAVSLYLGILLLIEIDLYTYLHNFNPSLFPVDILGRLGTLVFPIIMASLFSEFIFMYVRSLAKKKTQ